jgi:hypothetical protein
LLRANTVSSYEDPPRSTQEEKSLLQQSSKISRRSNFFSRKIGFLSPQWLQYRCWTNSKVSQFLHFVAICKPQSEQKASLDLVNAPVRIWSMSALHLGQRRLDGVLSPGKQSGVFSYKTLLKKLRNQ